MGVINGLPRLAVVSDVAPVRSQGGELLLHRLLEDYPVDQLRVVHSGRSPYFDPAKVLPGVRVDLVEYSYALPALLRSRWVPFWRAVELGCMGRHSGRLAASLADFLPEAVLTVTDFCLWRAAATYALRARLPLFLIQHDDLASKLSGNSPKLQHRFTRWLLNCQVRQAYRQAAARFCVSPGMADQYRSRFGQSAEIIYPCRGSDSPEPRVRMRPSWAGPPVIAFAGALYTEGGRELLRRLAEVLRRLGGRLDLYTRGNDDTLREHRLDHSNVRLVGFLPPSEMAERMAETAHALFLPASFLPNEAFDVSTLFPSKLADYTAVGLPILVWGPGYSSAARWAADNPGAAILVTDDAESLLPRVIQDLVQRPEWAKAMADRAVAVGCDYFGPDSTRSTLQASLRRVSDANA